MNFENERDKFLNYLSFRLKPTTVLQYQRKLDNHILPFFKDKKIDEISDNDYITWQKHIVSLGFSNSFNNHVFVVIKCFYNYLCMNYNIANLPLKYGKMINYNISKVKVLNVWSIKEFKIFINVVDKKEYHALFNFLFFTGCRKGEALCLHFNDIDGEYVNINKTITKELFNNKHLETTPKTKKSIRRIRIDKKLKIEIEQLKKYYNTIYSNFNNNFYVFGGIKPIAFTTLERYKNKYCDLAKIKRIRIHDFRHSHATILYNNNINAKAIQERLGHTNLTTTLDTYIHENNKQEKRVIRILNFLKLRF